MPRSPAFQERGNTVRWSATNTIASQTTSSSLGPVRRARRRHVVYHGSLSNLIKHSGDADRQVHAGSVRTHPRRTPQPKGWLTLRGVTTNNLKDIELSHFRSARTDLRDRVSSSGKKLTRGGHAVQAPRAGAGASHVDQPGNIRGIGGVEAIRRIVAIDQTPIGRTPRSNPATLYQDLRRIL